MLVDFWWREGRRNSWAIPRSRKLLPPCVGVSAILRAIDPHFAGVQIKNNRNRVLKNFNLRNVSVSSEPILMSGRLAGDNAFSCELSVEAVRQLPRRKIVEYRF